VFKSAVPVTVQCHGVTFKLAVPVPVTVTVRCHQTRTVQTSRRRQLDSVTARASHNLNINMVPGRWQRLHWQSRCFGVQVGCASQGNRRDRAVPCGATVFKLAAVPVTVPVTLRLTRKLAQARHRDWHAAGCRQSRSQFKCQCQWS
jgi:hypothetical protein